MRWRALLAFALACVGSEARGQEPPGGVNEPEPERLRVVVAGNPPFVVERDGRLDGVSVAVFRDVARRLGLRHEMVRVPNAGAAIDAVAAGEADLAVGPISITAARAERVAFTQPYYEGALAIATATEGASVFDHLAPFLTRAFVVGVGVLLLVLAGVGALFWLVERKRNDGIPRDPLRGIGTGMWLAIVTMTTVGYGDRVPVTPGGRVLAGAWMLVSMIIVSSLTAFLATALTLSQLDRGLIEEAEDLNGRAVAVVRGTTGERFAREHGARVRPAPDVEAALSTLAEGDVEAVVFDRPILLYHLRQNPDWPVALAEPVYEPLGYGFAVPRGSPLRARMDVVLLELSESGRVEAISRGLALTRSPRTRAVSARAR